MMDEEDPPALEAFKWALNAKLPVYKEEIQKTKELIKKLYPRVFDFLKKKWGINEQPKCLIKEYVGASYNRKDAIIAIDPAQLAVQYSIEGSGLPYEEYVLGYLAYNIVGYFQRDQGEIESEIRRAVVERNYDNYLDAGSKLIQHKAGKYAVAKGVLEDYCGAVCFQGWVSIGMKNFKAVKKAAESSMVGIIFHAHFMKGLIDDPNTNLRLLARDLYEIFDGMFDEIMDTIYHVMLATADYLSFTRGVEELSKLSIDEKQKLLREPPVPNPMHKILIDKALKENVPITYEFIKRVFNLRE